jgi:arylsulfatase
MRTRTTLGAAALLAAGARHGRLAASGRLTKTIPLQTSLGEGPDVGTDVGSPEDFAYELPFPFAGQIEKVRIDLLPK